MCDIRYFKAARHKLDVAKVTMSMYQHDELFIADVEYYLQQCVEFTLKAFLECKGLSIPETHQISKLIKMSDSNGSNCIITDWIRRYAVELTEWEAQSRYNFDYYVELKLLQEGIEEIEQFVKLNGLCDELDERITDDIKSELLCYISKNSIPSDNFEWNIYYHIFQKKLLKHTLISKSDVFDD